MSKKDKLPPEIVKEWPEVFKDIEIESIPISYLKAMNIHFADGNIWYIDIDHNMQLFSDPADLESSIEDLIEHHDDDIVNIDFKLNTKKVKEDISRRTKRFLKKRK